MQVWVLVWVCGASVCVCSADTGAYHLDQRTPLILAAERGFVGVVQALIQAKANVDAAPDAGMTALHAAAERNDGEIIQILAKAGANVNATAVGHHGVTPLHIAAQLEHLKAMSALINASADVDARDFNRETPVHKSAWFDQTDAVELLAQSGADLGAVCRSGMNALTRARERRPGGETEKVIRTYMGAWGKEDGEKQVPMTPLFSAVHIGGQHGEYAVRKLLDAGGDVNEAGEAGISLLQVASARGDLRMVKMLVERGANLLQGDDMNYTAMHSAVAAGEVSVIEELIRSGAKDNLNTQAGPSATPLFLSAL